MEGGDMYTKIVFEEENFNSIVSIDLLWIHFCLKKCNCRVDSISSLATLVTFNTSLK